jgi:DNA-binding XRE family transcriptional regulator
MLARLGRRRRSVTNAAQTAAEQVMGDWKRYYRATGPSPVRLRELRIKAGLTQRELSERAGMGKKYVGVIEQGRSKGGVKGWGKLAKALGVEVGAFYETPGEKGELSA